MYIQQLYLALEIHCNARLALRCGAKLGGEVIQLFYGENDVQCNLKFKSERRNRRKETGPEQSCRGATNHIMIIIKQVTRKRRRQKTGCGVGLVTHSVILE